MRLMQKDPGLQPRQEEVHWYHQELSARGCVAGTAPGTSLTLTLPSTNTASQLQRGLVPLSERFSDLLIVTHLASS